MAMSTFFCFKMLLILPLLRLFEMADFRSHLQRLADMPLTAEKTAILCSSDI